MKGLSTTIKLCLINHEYKYAVEQMMLTLFPGNKPLHVDESELEGFYAKSTFDEGHDYIHAHTVICRDGQIGEGRASIEKTSMSELEYVRQSQKLIRLSFYRAAVPKLSPPPPWGALTGIRPAKTLSDMLLRGESEDEALSSMERDYYVSPERAKLALMTAKSSLKVKNTLSPLDICLYIGIPFCPSRCAYCSFVSNSVEKTSHLIKPYLEALFTEIRTTADMINKLDLRVISVYMGGGTPTALSADELNSLMHVLRENIDLSHMREYTVEAGRPDTISREKLDVLNSYGVTRLSINPQSMRDCVLKAIGRGHTVDDIFDSIALTRDYSFDINMDLIAGLPGDSPAGFKESLNTLLKFNVENITVHTLSLKKGSRIMEENTEIPNAESVGEMLSYSIDTLRAHGYYPYYLYRQKYISGGFENMGYSLRDRENIYNICIMEDLCSVISVGAGGSTKLVAPQKGRIERIFNPKYPLEYIDRNIQKDGIRDFYTNLN